MAAYVIIPRKLLYFVLSGFNYGLHLLGSPRPVRPRPSPQPPALVPRSQDRARSRRANTPVSFSESFTLEPEYHEARAAIRARKGSPSDDDRFLSTKTTISLKTTSAAESGWTSSDLLTFSLALMQMYPPSLVTWHGPIDRSTCLWQTPRESTPASPCVSLR